MKRRHIFLLCLALLLCCPLLLNAQSSQTNYQYWIDNNKDEAVYGTVNGEDISLSIDASALSTGVHFYNIRAYETVGSKTKWGTIYRYLFSIPSSANEVPNNLSRYEYWLDNDYEHRVTTTVNSEESEALLSIDVNSLTPGVHFYNFRAQDVDGIWGTIYRYLFSIPYPQQANGNRLITGYSYAFNDGTVTSVVFDTPVEEYQLIKAFDIPQAQPPMVIDDNCGLEFDDEEYVATLSRNINMSFSLYFKDEAESIGSPVTTDFKVEDIQTQAIQIVSVPGNATIVSHENGGFSVVCFEVPTDMELLIQTDATSSLRLYSPYSQLLDSYDASSLTEGITREFEEGTYYAVIYGNTEEVTLTLGSSQLCGYAILDTSTGTLTFKHGPMPEGDNVWETENTQYDVVSPAPWDCPNLKKVVFDATYAKARPTSTAFWFYGALKLEEITGLEYLNTSEVTDMSSTFLNCKLLINLDVSHFNTSKVTNMSRMFSNCSELTSLNVSNFNTSNVTTMNQMFYNCSGITSLNVSNFNTSNVTDMIRMFSGCSGLTSLNVSNFNTSNVTSMYDMFANCSSLPSLNVTNFDTSNVKSMASMFSDCSGLTSLNVSNFDTSNVMYMNSMFSGCSRLTSLNVSNFDTSNVTSMHHMFSGCSSLTSLNVTNFDTSNVNHMASMFNNCSGLTSLNVTNFDTGKVMDMSYMFAGCSGLTSLDLSNFNTSNVTNMCAMFTLCYNLKTLKISSFDTGKVTSMDGMFNSCNELTSLDVSLFNTSNVTNMTCMFSFCCKLTSLNLSNFDTNKVSNMWGMFQYCSNLTSLDLSGFRTDKVKDMKAMFNYCLKLENLDISNFNTEQVTKMNDMFQLCVSLKNWDLSHFDTGNVTDMNRMFNECGRLESLIISSFNTSNVTDMTLMFAKTNSLQTLDLSSFDTSNVTDMDSLFCSSGPSHTRYWWSKLYGYRMPSQQWTSVDGTKLKTIYVSDAWTTTNVEKGNYMFGGCTALVGEKGTTYSASHVDKTYARIDNAPSAPGYFTYKAPVQKGDANGDGTIDTQDAIKVVQYYLGKNPTDFNIQAADVNNDGVVDTQDAIQIIKIYLKKE